MAPLEVFRSADLGADGDGPPTPATNASGIRGWLRGIYDALQDLITAQAETQDVDVLLPVEFEPSTTGGLSTFHSLDLDETEEAVKATPGQVYGWVLENRAGTERVVKFYDATVATVVVGTTTPKFVFSLAGGQRANVSLAHGITFATAITAAATTGIADSDVAAPATNDVVATVFYK